MMGRKGKYSYAWLDKVVQTNTNGDCRSFSYYPDGQLAEAVGAGKTEEFYWNRLALVRRDNTLYMNEPSVTGGNPVIADNKVLFNDMLGNTIGTKDGETFNLISRDSFGGGNEEGFFTGKPYVEGLGYAFLFRNYRPELGKWQTADPLGYPDGWNNFAYCNNKILNHLDPLGLADAKVGYRNLDVPYVGWVGSHSSMLITLTPEEFDNLSSELQNGFDWQPTDDGGGDVQTWIGGQNINGDINSTNGYYYDNPNLIDYNVDVDCESMYEFCTNFLELVSDYPNNTIPYDGTPDGNDGNCNSFLNTLIQNAGGSVDPDDVPYNAYGWYHIQKIAE